MASRYNKTDCIDKTYRIRELEMHNAFFGNYEQPWPRNVESTSLPSELVFASPKSSVADVVASMWRTLAFTRWPSCTEFTT